MIPLLSGPQRAALYRIGKQEDWVYGVSVHAAVASALMRKGLARPAVRRGPHGPGVAVRLTREGRRHVAA